MKGWQYRIIELAKRGELEEVVNLAMEEGWEAIGGVAVVCCGDEDLLYVQAMVRQQVKQ